MSSQTTRYVFTSPTHGRIGLVGIVRDIATYVRTDPASYYRVVIGSDSQMRGTNGDTKIDYVTAIVIHRVGKGARYYWRKQRELKARVLRDKIYKETILSLELAEAFVPKLRKAISPANYDLEIHIDVGALGPTREMIREVVGMVTGSGFTAKTKPDSWAASSVADKHT